MKEYSRGFQKSHYDSLCQGKAQSGSPLSCSFEERYDPLAYERDAKGREFFSSIFRRVCADSSSLVLDCCTGSGQLLPVLARLYTRVVGVDISKGLLREAAKVREISPSCRILLAQSEAESLSLASGVFDLAILVDSLHHVEDQLAALNELKRVLKPGGKILIIEPNVGNPLVFLAHAWPSEERGALRNGTKQRMLGLLAKLGGRVSATNLNYVASQKQGALSKLAARACEIIFGKLLVFWPIRIMYLVEIDPGNG